MALFPARDDWAACRDFAQLDTSPHEDMHPGEIETSILLHVSPELVRDGYHTADHVANDRRHMLTLGLHAYTTSGVVGRPSLATADKGKLILESLVSEFSKMIDIIQQD